MSSKETVLIAGGSGLIGSHLIGSLENWGYQVGRLVRNSEMTGQDRTYVWDPVKGSVPSGVLERYDHIIVLNGAGIADRRWTKKRKVRLLESRTLPHRALISKLLENRITPKSYTAASAVGYYGYVDGLAVSEDDVTSAPDFLSRLCHRWEDSHANGPWEQTRRIVWRIGIVLSARGGALRRLAASSVVGVIPYFGSGQQYLPWIHIDDLARIIRFGIESKITGTFNASAPHCTTGKELAKSIARAVSYPAVTLSIPPFALQVLYGEMSQTVLSSSRVLSDKIQREGFTFLHEDLDHAVRDLMARRI